MTRHEFRGIPGVGHLCAEYEAERGICGFPASADIHMPDTAKDAQGANTAQEAAACLACSPELPDATGLCSVHASAPALKAENEILRTALTTIAAFDDAGASRHLELNGSYGRFDEPFSVRVAREALKS